jgi:hypothetical protein
MPNKPTITLKKVGSRFSIKADNKWKPHLMKGGHDFLVEGGHDFIDFGVHDAASFDIGEHNVKKVKVQLDKAGNLGLSFE